MMPEVWPKRDRPARYYTLPLTTTAKVELSGPFPLTAREWERFMHLIATMAPGLREEPEARVPVDFDTDEGSQAAAEPAGDEGSDAEPLR